MKESRKGAIKNFAVLLGIALLIGGIAAANPMAQPQDSNTKAVKKAFAALQSHIGLREKENIIGDTITTFGGMFIDEDQSALYVYVMDQKDAEEVQRIVSPYKNEINLRILKGTYSFKQLMKWKNDLALVLETRGGELGITTLDIDETRNILKVGMETIDVSKVSALKQELEKLNIPQEAVEVIETGPIQLVLSRQDRFDPLIGGIQIATTSVYCTLGFTATKSGVKGIVTAGHCANVNDAIYQPTVSSSNKIGNVASDPRGPRWSDALWTPVSGRNIAYKTYPDYTVTGYVPSWNQVVGENICKGGRTTGETCGTITQTCTTVSHPEYGTLYCQYFASFGVSSGDSGSPAYKKSGSTVSLYGVVWGSSGGGGVYSTVDEIFNDLGSMTIS